MTDLKLLLPKMMVAIIDRNKAKIIQNLLVEQHVHIAYCCMGEGTVKSELLSLLGLGSTDKAVIVCLAPGPRMPHLIQVVGETFNLEKKGMGIAFTMPLSGINASVFQMLEKEVLEKIEKKVECAVEQITHEITNDLILAVINQGYSDELMTAAKQAGATGGTVMRGRRSGSGEITNFFGISVQEEIEIVAILASRDKKAAIMKAASQAVGIKTEAQGMLIALPVESVIGMHIQQEIAAEQEEE